MSQVKQDTELKVFITTGDSSCGECGEQLGRHAWITLVEGKGALCLACADLDHLAFLLSGDAALTRRARKHSTLSAVKSTAAAWAARQPPRLSMSKRYGWPLSRMSGTQRQTMMPSSRKATSDQKHERRCTMPSPGYWPGGKHQSDQVESRVSATPLPCAVTI